MYRQGLILCLAVTLIFSAGCAMKKKPQEETAAVPPQTQTVTHPADTSQVAVVDQGITDEAVAEENVTPAPAAPQLMEPTPEPLLAAALQNVPFEYDQHLLSETAQDILVANAAILKAQHRLQVTLAGYCDERGADQYNIALGERRVEAVRSYLLSLGISAARLDAVSFGEEKPLDPGHNESAWVKNRRVEFMPRS